MSLITLPQTAKIAGGRIAFAITRSQQALVTAAGVAQITSFPDRRWTARVEINPQWESDLRLWSVAMTQLSDFSNYIALGPPHYSGPSTGYAGAGPVVDGPDQLGLSLAVDGLTPSTAILLKGDFISFDTTSPKSNTNRQLIQVAANVTSGGSGDATITLTTPIRQAPEDGAAVQIFTPTAFFMLQTPEGGVEMDGNQFSTFVLNCIERVFP